MKRAFSEVTPRVNGAKGLRFPTGPERRGRAGLPGSQAKSKNHASLRPRPLHFRLTRPQASGEACVLLQSTPLVPSAPRSHSGPSRLAGLPQSRACIGHHQAPRLLPKPPGILASEPPCVSGSRTRAGPAGRLRAPRIPPGTVPCFFGSAGSCLVPPGRPSVHSVPLGSPRPRSAPSGHRRLLFGPAGLCPIRLPQTNFPCVSASSPP